jgi:Fe-S-cluster-containing dehydrogenase component
VSVQQPMIEPLYGGRSVIELLQLMVGEKPNGYTAVRTTHNAAANEKAWRKVVHDGFVADSAATPLRVANAETLRRVKAVPAKTTKIGEFEVLVRPDYSLYDGRYANNGWMQELPDPVTKIVWDNAARLSPSDCKKLGVTHGSVLNINRYDVPVYPMPGQASGVLVMTMGYGRQVVGPVGQEIGVDALAMVRSGEGSGVVVTGRNTSLVTTQDHHAIDVREFEEAGKRVGQLIRQGTLAEYKAHPEFAYHLGVHTLKDKEGIPLQQWDPPVDFDQASPQQWGMAVDLTACTGCNACVVACQAENNIPIVGKDQVEGGREMHWLRVDRYFTGAPDDAEHVQAVHQPVMCQHCENAPCEQVCPVAATVHDSEGLNVMVYNRCIGTRYCSNNCPYKVRRFNYYDWHVKEPHKPAKPFVGMPDQEQQQIDEVRRMQFNPQVTVRMRGVMHSGPRHPRQHRRGPAEARAAGDG